MPNHVTTTCTVTGPEWAVGVFESSHIVQGVKEPAFDFNTIVPMPAAVRDTVSGSSSRYGLAALVGDAVDIHRREFEWCPAAKGLAPVAMPGAVRAWLAEHNPTWLEEGRKACAAVAETGFTDWYEWSIANWGTKWGAYQYERLERADGKFVFRFQTAWSFPETIFRLLAKRYSSLVLSVASYDEGGGFACEGEFNGANDYRTVEASDDLYFRAYGRTRDDDDEEDA